MNADAFRMNRFTLRFAGADVEAAYAQEQARKAVRPVRIALACLGVLIQTVWGGGYMLATEVRRRAAALS